MEELKCFVDKENVLIYYYPATEIIVSEELK
jgi:hypothetical protein